MSPFLQYMHTLHGIQSNWRNANVIFLFLCILQLTNDIFCSSARWLKYHHPHLVECGHEATSRWSTREQCLCTTLTVPASKAVLTSPLPLPVSSNCILFSHITLFLKRLPQCSQSHSRIPIQLRDTNRSKANNCTFCFVIFTQTLLKLIYSARLLETRLIFHKNQQIIA